MCGNVQNSQIVADPDLVPEGAHLYKDSEPRIRFQIFKVGTGSKDF